MLLRYRTIDCRYPAELAGPRYPDGIPIWPEDDLEKVIQDQKVDRCLLAYSDLHNETVMTLASRCLAAGTEFFLASPTNTMLKSSKPVVAVVAVRTGCGKSQTSRYVINALKKRGKVRAGASPHAVRQPCRAGGATF